ncbi:hypothetical protein K3G39_13885 [Pontibacter sp. HSC-14F20]|uniref:hypothetical protein n=1 Tax=Pontibacter sp. HSC-14F20 TaxID=2864136 RepID=UPI001C729EBC|nr:hypothetical protein [Pontibacter sp. HSC-14F20]MBX0334329.1 hypothetical protein [Pontibacter sp. HSC-14F20]
MKLIHKWWIPQLLFIWVTVVLVALEIAGVSLSYNWYVLLAAAVLILVSVLYLLYSRQLVKAVAALVFPLLATYIGVILVSLLASFSMLTKGHTNTLNTAYYKAEFENHTRSPFPPSARFLVNDETVQGGGVENEFDAYCLIRLPKAEYQQLLTQISVDPEFSKDNAAPDFSRTVLAGKVKAADFSASFSHDDTGFSWYTISFHEDGIRVALKISTY